MKNKANKTSIKKSEQGQIALQFVAILPLIVIVIALMVDIGGASLAYQKAQAAADSAAFAAGQTVDQRALFERNSIQLDHDLAASVAGQYASINSDNQLEIVGIHVENEYVIVIGRTQYITKYLHAIGISAYEIVVYGKAAPAFGINNIGE